MRGDLDGSPVDRPSRAVRAARGGSRQRRRRPPLDAGVHLRAAGHDLPAHADRRADVLGDARRACLLLGSPAPPATCASFIRRGRIMILTGPEIIRQHGLGTIRIDPFNADQVNPNSYNFRLGRTVKVYKNDVLDPKVKQPTVSIAIPQDGLVLASRRTSPDP